MLAVHHLPDFPEEDETAGDGSEDQDEFDYPVLLDCLSLHLKALTDAGGAGHVARAGRRGNPRSHPTSHAVPARPARSDDWRNRAAPAWRRERRLRSPDSSRTAPADRASNAAPGPGT